jgi:hypothetical protein
VSIRGGWGLAWFLVSAAGAAVVLAACADDLSRPGSPATSPSAAPRAAPVTVAAGGVVHQLPASAMAASLVGLSAGELSALIGAPRWSRRESPAQVWQYQGASCVLDVYLYEEAGGPRVVYAEARDESRLPVTLSACLERIEAERRRPAAPAS